MNESTLIEDGDYIIKLVSSEGKNVEMYLGSKNGVDWINTDIFAINKLKFKEIGNTVIRISKILSGLYKDFINKDFNVYMILPKMCLNCKYWSGRRVSGSTSGNCELHIKNMSWRESCKDWCY